MYAAKTTARQGLWSQNADLRKASGPYESAGSPFNGFPGFARHPALRAKGLAESHNKSMQLT